MEFDNFITHLIDLYFGKPKSGKTIIAGSYPKPLLYVSVGNDGGGRVLMMKYRKEIENGEIKVKNLKNDYPVAGKINKTSIEKLAQLLADLRKPDAPKFKTIVVDTIGALQDDYKSYMEFTKGGKALSQQEWGDVAKMMISIKDNMKRFSEEFGVQFVWISHTSEQEMTETSGLNKEIRIIPDLTIKTGVKYMKDASNIFYVCRKTIINDDGEKSVKFLTYVGPHPVMDTGTRDMELEVGEFVENFNYDTWQRLVKLGSIKKLNVLTIENNNKENEIIVMVEKFSDFESVGFLNKEGEFVFEVKEGELKDSSKGTPMIVIQAESEEGKTTLYFSLDPKARWNYNNFIKACLKLDSKEKIQKFECDYELIHQKLIGKKFIGTVEADTYDKIVKKPLDDGTFEESVETKISYKVKSYAWL